jgi:hypothetical protein
MVSTTLTYVDGTPSLSVTNPVTPQAVGFTISAGTTSKTLTVALDASVSGTNTGDQFTSVSTSKILGRGSAAGAGAAQEITLGTNLEMDGTTLNVTGAGAGSVTSVSVVSANGMAGTVADASTTPAITLLTTITGMLKGASSTIAQATDGTDYLSTSTGALAGHTHSSLTESDSTTVALSVNADGDVGIGSTSATAKLETYINQTESEASKKSLIMRDYGINHGMTYYWLTDAFLSINRDEIAGLNSDSTYPGLTIAGIIGSTTATLLPALWLGAGKKSDDAYQDLEPNDWYLAIGPHSEKIFNTYHHRFRKGEQQFTTGASESVHGMTDIIDAACFGAIHCRRDVSSSTALGDSGIRIMGINPENCPGGPTGAEVLGLTMRQVGEVIDEGGVVEIRAGCYNGTTSAGDLGANDCILMVNNFTRPEATAVKFMGDGTIIAPLFQGTFSGSIETASTSAVSTTVAVTNEASDTTCFPMFSQSATGNNAVNSNAALTFNAATGTLGATVFSGNLTGNVTGDVTGSSGSCTGNAVTASTSGVSTTVTVANEASDTSCNILFATEASGNLGVKSNSGLVYNSAANSLTVTKVIGMRIPSVYSTTYSATTTPNIDTYDVIDLTAISDTLVWANPSGTPTNEQKLMLKWKDNGTSRAMSFGTSYASTASITFPSSTTAGKTGRMMFIYNAANSVNKWEAWAYGVGA